MMASELDTRLGDLGPRFLRFLYRCMILSDHSLCLVAERNGQIVGHFTVLTSRRNFFRQFVLRKGLLAALMLLPWLLRPRNLQTAITGLTFSRNAAQDDPDAEAASLIVVSTAHRTGVGKALFEAILAELRKKGIRRMRSTTSPHNEAANALHKRQGGVLLRTEPFYRGESINVYVFDIV
jgi:ribosomal protein S18 acetylase RimI-like enzyme